MALRYENSKLSSFLRDILEFSIIDAFELNASASESGTSGGDCDDCEVCDHCFANMLDNFDACEGIDGCSSHL